MLSAGIHIVPLMPVADVVALAVEAERLGYDYCMVADEGFHPDIYACLGAIAVATDRIKIGAMTNPYTRHPAVTASALATIDEMSNGRAHVCLLAGGSMVLNPMGIERTRPYRKLADALEVLRRLWSGEEVTWQGETCSLDRARLGLGAHEIPVWIASRGPMLLGLAGRSADGAVLTVRPDLGAALQIVDDAALIAERPSPERIYLGRICYTPAMLEGQRRTLSFVLMDSPPRVLRSLGFDDAALDLVAEGARTNQPGLVDPLVTNDLLRQYQISGSTEECTDALAKMAEQHRLDTVLIDALASGLTENLDVLRQTLPIIKPPTTRSPKTSPPEPTLPRQKDTAHE